jgi:S-adenosylmethionine:tRNA ribosyltransferase-isomerase
VFGTHTPTGRPIEVRLAGRRSLDARHVHRFVAVAFGAGDFRTPTESRVRPPAFTAGDVLRLGPLDAEVLSVLGHPRLIEMAFRGSPEEIWEGLARYGRPIQYSYLREPLAVWDTWTRIANVPVAFEAPSAGFLLDWRMVDSLRIRGATFATLTHAAGISSTGDEDLDALLPLDEPYDIPRSTAASIEATRRRGGRIIAIGTTVVRALEDAALRLAVRGEVRSGPGRVPAGAGLATLRIGPHTQLRVVEALVTGQHEPGTSHYELLRAFLTDDVLRKVDAEVNAHAYRAHEFGDSMFVVRSR